MGERTLTGLCALLQENRLRQALAPYVLDGPHGRLLDAEGESLGEGDVQAFEMEQLLHARGAALPVLTYLFHRLEQRFDGAPTLLVLDEAWTFLDDPVFAGRIREWLRSEEHTSELQSLMRLSYAVFFLNKNKLTKS